MHNKPITIGCIEILFSKCSIGNRTRAKIHEFKNSVLHHFIWKRFTFPRVFSILHIIFIRNNSAETIWNRWTTLQRHRLQSWYKRRSSCCCNVQGKLGAVSYVQKYDLLLTLKWVQDIMYTFSIALQIVNVYKFSGTHFIIQI